MLLSFAVTSATYFYSYKIVFPMAFLAVYRGWPLAWVVEKTQVAVLDPNPSAPMRDFQALNFFIDLVLWMTIFLLPSSFYLYRTKLRARLGLRVKSSLR
jgi:hypothetical protein